MHYTLGEAAKRTGLSKPTIQRAIKSGKLSANRNEDGSYSIDPAEVERVYGPLPVTGNGDSNETQNVTAVSSNETGPLQAEVQNLRERLSSMALERDRERAQLTDQIEDLRRRLDAEAEERRKLTALLTHERPETEAPATNAGRGFWARFRRKA